MRFDDRTREATDGRTPDLAALADSGRRSAPSLVLLRLVAGLFLIPIARRLRDREANAAMAAAPAPIDGQRAYKYLKQICDDRPAAGRDRGQRQTARRSSPATSRRPGPRSPSSRSPASTRSSNAQVAMVNLVGSWHPERPERVVIGAHYDTRPFPDEDRDPARRTLPFIGANDGASGVALLMEIAHHLDELPTPWGVDLVLFDGEELVYGAGSGPERRILPRARRSSPGSTPTGSTRGRSKSRYVAGIVRRHGGRPRPQDRPGRDTA